MMHIWCCLTFAVIYQNTENTVWWLNLGQLPDTYPAVLSLPLLHRIGGENKMEKLIGQDKDRAITYQLPSWTEQCQLLPIKTDLDSEKQNQKD